MTSKRQPSQLDRTPSWMPLFLIDENAPPYESAGAHCTFYSHSHRLTIVYYTRPCHPETLTVSIAAMAAAMVAAALAHRCDTSRDHVRRRLFAWCSPVLLFACSPVVHLCCRLFAHAVLHPTVHSAMNS